MELELILKWLYQYTEKELELKNHFEKYHRIMPDTFSREQLRSADGIRRLHQNDLRNAAMPNVNTPADICYDPQLLREPVVFSDDSDIFIHKHPRYSEVTMHKHQFFEIVYVYEGCCTQLLKSSVMERRYIMHEGDFLFIPADQKHALRVDSDSLVINIGVRTSTFKRTFLHNVPPDSILGGFFSALLTMQGSTQFILFHTRNIFSFRPCLHQLFQSYCTPGIYSKNIVDLQLSLLFLYLLQECSSQAELINTVTNSFYQIPAIITYMEENYTSLNVKELARHFGYSSDHLNRIFRQCTSMTVSDTLLKIKMDHAGRMLRNKTLTIGQISDMLGYADTTNFIRNFKKYYGTTPKIFRNQTNAQK